MMGERNVRMRDWKHIFKLDPAKYIDEQSIKQICESGTDAIIIGGTDNVTSDNVLQLLSIVEQYPIPRILEISTNEAITPGFDYYFIPMVMNSKDKKWMMDVQHQAIKEYGIFMDWDSIFMEGYCILNDASKAYIRTNCRMPDEDDVLAYAQMAEHIFHLPIFYIEYSGTYGDPLLVEQTKYELNDTLLFYGGGIKNAAQAMEMKKHADVIVVGNSIYTDLESALETVDAVKHM